MLHSFKGYHLETILFLKTFFRWCCTVSPFGNSCKLRDKNSVMHSTNTTQLAGQYFFSIRNKKPFKITSRKFVLFWTPLELHFYIKFWNVLNQGLMYASSVIHFFMLAQIRALLSCQYQTDAFTNQATTAGLVRTYPNSKTWWNHLVFYPSWVKVET